MKQMGHKKAFYRLHVEPPRFCLGWSLQANTGRRFGTSWGIYERRGIYQAAHYRRAGSGGVPGAGGSGGGQIMALIITAAALRPAVREACLMTVFSVPVSGRWDRQPGQNGNRKRKNREEKWLHPACSDFAISYPLAEQTFTGAVP